MRVLLLGEFSSLHRYLKEGLQELGGIEVELYANGDGWKKITGADGVLYNSGSNFINRVYNYFIDAYKKANTFQEYDVVQIVNPTIYPDFINETILRLIAKKNKSLSVVAAGYSEALVNAYQSGIFDYYVYDYDKYSVNRYTEDSFRNKLIIHNEKWVNKHADIIIPSLYEYTVGYKSEDLHKLYNVIPFPINLSDLKYQENNPKNKVVFFHGINRELAKGTPFIREALEKLQEKYPNDVEVIIDGKMPFKEYVEVMQRANVVVDQCCSYGYGINACIAMAQGKVVVSGARQETLNAFGIEKTPMLCAKPDVGYLYNQFEYILQQKKNLAQLGYDSRQYVENLHDHVKVAQQYVDAWKSTGKIV